jgi:hypothetical protein
MFNKRDETQEGEPLTASTEAHAAAQAPAAELGRAPDAAAPVAASTPDAARASSAARAREAAQPPVVPKPAHTSDPEVTIELEVTQPALAGDPDVTIELEVESPPRAASEPRDAKVMSEKSAKPTDSSIKPPEASPGRPPASGERPELSVGKSRAIPPPTAAAARPAPPEIKGAPRSVNAALLKAAQAAADKRAAPRPGPEGASAKAQEGSSAYSAAVSPAPRAAGVVAAQPAPRSAPTPPAGAPVTVAAPVETPAPLAPAAPAKQVEPQPSPRQLFEASAPRLLDGLLHLMLELRGCESAPGDWARDSAGSLRTLRATAAKLGEPALLEALDGMLELLERVERDGLARIDGALRDALLRAHESLRTHVPAAGDPDCELERREPMLVEQILLQVNGVQLTTLRKLHVAGWTTSESFLRRSSAELVRDTGLDAALAERIIGAFRAFRGQFATLAPAPARAEELRHLALLLDELRAQQARFEQASARFGPEDLRQRREHRVARARSLRGIYALLARLGELERIAALERAPFQAKIAELTDYLSSARRSAAFVS